MPPGSAQNFCKSEAKAQQLILRRECASAIAPECSYTIARQKCELETGSKETAGPPSVRLRQLFLVMTSRGPRKLAGSHSFVRHPRSDAQSSIKMGNLLVTLMFSEFRVAVAQERESSYSELSCKQPGHYDRLPPRRTKCLMSKLSCPSPVEMSQAFRILISRRYLRRTFRPFGSISAEAGVLRRNSPGGIQARYAIRSDRRSHPRDRAEE